MVKRKTVNKKINKKVKINKSKKNQKAVYGFGIALVLVMVVALIMGLTKFPTTGAAITVKSYGVSDELIISKSGTIQTLLKMDKPTLKLMGTVNGREKIAADIYQQLDLSKSIVQLYQNNPAATVSSLSYPGLDNGAKIGNTNFMKNSRCLKEIGAYYRARPGFDFVLVSELKYQSCQNKKDWQYAYLKHSFYEEKAHAFVCTQDDEMMFAISNSNGEVTTDTTDC